MFWKLILLAMVVWAVALYFSVTLGGFIHVVPVAALACMVMRRMGKDADTAFGRWRPAADRAKRR